MDGMLDLAGLMKQHAQISLGLAELQMLTSHLSGAIMVSPTKANNLVPGMLMVITSWPSKAQNDCMKCRSCRTPCAVAESNATSSA